MYTFLQVNIVNINNPFDAPVYYKESVKSTMDEARQFAGEKTGTVLVAGEQSAGRGRAGRPWKTGKNESLSFTVLLQFGEIANIPSALTLRTGLATALAIEDFAPALAGKVLVKWPNDIMLTGKDGQGRKAVGILTEADGGTVYIGIGINISQKEFPPELEKKAASIAQILMEINNQEELHSQLTEKRFTLLEKILYRLHEEINTPAYELNWQKRLEEKLFLKGRRVCFIPGLPEEISSNAAPEKIEGVLHGIGKNGEIRIMLDSGEIVSFVSGELKL